MRIAALQTVATPSLERNLEVAQRLIAEAAGEGAERVALPEYFCFMGHSDRDKLALAEAPGDGPIQRMLAEDQPYIFLYANKAYAGVSNRLGGIVPSPLGLDWNLEQWYVR